MLVNTGTRSVYLTLLLGLLILAQGVQQANAASDPDYIGVIVDDESGEPIPDADITVFYRRFYRRYSSRWYTSKTTSSDIDGRFELDLNDEYGYLFLITHETGGEHDYVPYGVSHTPTGAQTQEEIMLWRAEKVMLVGRDFFIETTAIPDITVRVLDPPSLSPIKYGYIGLYYGTGAFTLSSYLDLPMDTIFVPQDRDYMVKVSALSEINGEQLTETMLLEEEAIDQATMQVNLRSLVVQRNIVKLQNITETIEETIIDKEGKGFFLSVERQKLGKAENLIASSSNMIESGVTEEAFTMLREAYVILSDLDNSISSLYMSATRSVFILIVFIGLTSQVLATLLFEEDSKKIITGALVFTILLGVLYWLHPGAQITAREDLLKMGGYTLIGVSGLGLFVPRVIQHGSQTDSPNLRHMVLPILSIAKRSLLRRKLRFLLTLTSVLLLVASFISLTSFSSGFGLSLEKVGDPLGKEGVMIRSPDPPLIKSPAPFSGGIGVSGQLPLGDELLDWFRDEKWVSEFIPRYESYPQRQYREDYSPLSSVGWVDIFGILSVDPTYEADVNSLDSTIVEGEYLSGDAGEVLVSEEMADDLDFGIGETFTIDVQGESYEVTIVGLMDDDALEELSDIDGDSLLPRKIVEKDRIEFDGPDYVLEGIAPCDPDEVIIISHATSENMTFLGFTRLNLVLDTGVDTVEYARTTALNRGFRVWASTGSGVYLAQLSGYFNGKGLPIMIPWVIVVLNVVVTMMNAYYERRHEVMIFSSIGMNPRHISAIFLAEATVTGVLGGCLGYLLGLGAYKFIYIMTPALQVQQKVSAIWSLGAIGISLAAVLIGGMVALRNSVSITPSLKRRWVLDQKAGNEKVTKIRLPVHVYREELGEYYDFLEDRLKQRSKTGDMVVRMLKREVEGENTVFSFIYCTEGTTVSRLYTKNKLAIELGEDETYSTTLHTEGDSDSVKRAGGLMRKICLEWSMNREG